KGNTYRKKKEKKKGNFVTNVKFGHYCQSKKCLMLLYHDEYNSPLGGYDILF
ncbi:MAG: hypothetical protein ACI90V_003779, partial [Bacillariaceae sp.]